MEVDSKEEVKKESPTTPKKEDCSMASIGETLNDFEPAQKIP